MRKMIVSVILFILVATSVCAQTVLVRQDMVDGEKPFTTVGLLGRDIEVWYFGAGLDYGHVEVGRLFLAHKGEKSVLLAGSYAGWWPTNGRLAVVPFVCGSVQLPGEVKLSGNLSGHLPLNTKAWVAFSDEVAITRKIGDLELGPALSFWAQERVTTRVRLGIKAQTGPIQVRWLAPHSGAPAQARVQLTLAL